jgi:hypothetical protein
MMIGFMLPMVKPLPGCMSGITARWRKMQGIFAVSMSYCSALPSTGTPCVQRKIGWALSEVMAM